MQTGPRATGLNEEAQLLSRPPFIDNTPGTLSILHHPNNSDGPTCGKYVLPLGEYLVRIRIFADIVRQLNSHCK